MSFEKIIVLDDEMVIRKTLEQQLRKRRYAVASADSLATAQALLGKDRFDLMFVDVRLPDGKGTELLELFQRDPDAPMVIMITGYGSIEDAVECMRLGAFGYIQKPFSQDQIDIQIKKAEEYAQAVKVNRYYSEAIQGDSEIIGESKAVVKMKKVIRQVARTDVSILISGENGTGKELVAREIYKLSQRADKPYIRVNCAAVTENLVESEFFGHEKGSFTGATERREGRFELANGGTILLDEISEIPINLQAKLLRVLQEKEFERVGGTRTMRVDVRVLSATNRNLAKAIEGNQFREDLYHRLAVFPIPVPPLRDREGDVLLLADEFLKRYSKEYGIKLKGFSKEAIGMIEEYHWPGNVRELENTIQRAVILAEEGKAVPGSALMGLAGAGMVTVRSATPAAAAVSEDTEAEDAPELGDEDEEGEAAAPAASRSDSPLNEGTPLEEVEKQHILATLKANDGNRKVTAAQLKVSIRTLRNKLNLYREQGEDIP